MKKTIEIKRCLQRKDGIKMVIIPKHSDIKKDELVLVSNDLDYIKKLKKEE